MSALLSLAMPLLLSEVLANEPGSTVSLEWIELAAQADVNPALYTLEVNGVAIALPDLALDSGGFLVVCRDTTRFEAHYGDSSGAWGDHAGEAYPLKQAGFSLVNSSGELRLYGPGGTDLFAWSSAAPDGVSFERIGDSLWQITASPPGATPGAHNHGAPLAFDWAVGAFFVSPALPRRGEAFTLKALLENRGSTASTSHFAIVEEDDVALGAFDVTGEPAERVEIQVEGVAHEGLNRFTARLDPDERNEDNEATVGFYGSAEALRISEVYGAPAGSEPEWLEFYVSSDTALSLSPFSLVNGTSVVPSASDTLFALPHSYVVITPDSAALRRRYIELATPVLQVAAWPTLANSGATLSLLWGEYLTDRVVYPSFGSRRGVSLERIGEGDVWGLSVAPAGATPGEPNSIDVPYSDQIELYVAPNPFAAREGEQAAIRYTVPFGAKGEVRLFAGDGRLLRALHPQAPIVSGAVFWDGRDAGGALCPVGVYLVQLRITAPFEQARLATVVIAR